MKPALTFILFLTVLLFVHAQDNTSLTMYEFNANGLKVIVKKAPKQIVSVIFVIKGGTGNYSKAEEGIESLAVQWATEGGTVNYSKRMLNQQMDSLGTEIDYYVGYDYALIEMTCLNKNWNESWQLFKDIIVNPKFDKKQFNLTKNQLISDAKYNNQDPNTKLKYLAMANVFQNMNYEKIPEGTTKSLSAISPEQALAYYKTYVTKENCFLVIVGDLEQQGLKDQIVASLKELPRGVEIAPITQNFTIAKGNPVIHNRKTETNYIRGYMNAPRLESKEGLMMQLGMNMLNERIFETVRRNAGLSYNPRAFYATGIVKQPYTLLYVSTPKPADAITLMVGVVNEVRESGFVDDELIAQKATFLTNYYLDQETTSSQCDDITMNELRGNWQNIYLSPEKLSSITLIDINQVFNKYTDVIRWTYLGDEEKVLASDFIDPVEIANKK